MAQMPGQAQGFKFAPQQAAGTPAAMVQNFKQIEDLPTLIAMQQRNPSIPLLAHIDDVRKRLEARQAMQSQLAMRQAQQQGPQTLNDQILGSAEQVAGMAPVRRMATGGIVALQSGGDPEVKRILAKPPYQRTQEENAKLEAAGVPLVQRNLGPSGNWIERLNNFLESPFFRETFTGGASRLSAEDLKKRTDAGAVTERIARGLGAQQVAAPAPAAATAPAAAPYPEPVAVREGRRAAPAAAAEVVPRERRTPAEKPTAERRQGPPPAAAAPAAPDTITQALNALVAASTTPAEVPAALREQRAKVAGIQELMTKQAMDEATRVRDEMDRELARREGRLNKPFLEGDMLPLLASFLSAKKGEFFPSLAKGLAAVSTEEEKARRDIAQYRATEGERVRQLNNTYRQLQLEQAKYQEALLSGDMKTARESAEKIAQLRYNAAVKTEELKNDRMRADAALAQARAAGISAGAQAAAVPSRIDAATQGAQTRLLSAMNNDPEMQALRKRLETPLVSDADYAAITARMRSREQELLLKYAPELAALGQTAGAGGSSGTRKAADAILEGTR